MENEKDLIFRTGLTILDERGSYEPRDGVRVAHIYEDDKIHMEALMSLQGGGQIESFLISVKMFPLDEMPVRPFGIPKTPPEKQTPVFVWRGIPRYYRTGRWEGYLRMLIEDIRREDEQVDALNGHPIDDSELFPDENNSDAKA